MRILALLLFLPFCIQAQIEAYNLGLTDSTVRILYRGYDNVIVYHGVEVDSTFTLLIGEDTAGRYAERFYPKPKKSGNDTLRLYRGEELVHTAVFETRRFPQLSELIHLGDLKDSIVSREQLLANPGLYASYELELIKGKIRVQEFRGYLTYPKGYMGLYPDGLQSEFREVGPYFSDDLLREISNLPSGESIVIGLVRIIGGGICPRLVAVNLKFTIRD